MIKRCDSLNILTVKGRGQTISQKSAISFGLLATLFCLALVLISLNSIVPVANARGGGGHSFSSKGSSSSSSRSSSSSSKSSSSRSVGTTSSGGSSSGGSTGTAGSSYGSPGYGGSSTYTGSRGSGFPLLVLVGGSILVVILVIVIGVAVMAARSRGNAPPESVTGRDDLSVAARFEELRKYDPNVSEILFTDFIYTLFGQVQKARGRGEVENYSSYLDASVIEKLKGIGGPGMKDVIGVIVGSSHIQNVSDPAEATITITVQFETNYTEVYAAPGAADTSNTWYTREQWSFSRKRDLLSRTPETVRAMHCPSCGGGLEKKPDGSCVYCGVKIVGGEFDWFVTGIQILERISQGPVLTQDVEEVGNDLPTVVQANFDEARGRLVQADPEFRWEAFEQRLRYIFMELQQAWTTLQWERVRPFETDNVFQMHYFWINEYQKQKLRNVLERIAISNVVPVKVTTDAFYDSITARIYASMVDYTVDAQGSRVCGDPNKPREFTEYWTFIRRRGAKSVDKKDDQCPNCGAALQINMAGICEFCGGKVSSGDFNWVLSRIEQDESYEG